MIKRILKTVVRLIIREYSIYGIYKSKCENDLGNPYYCPNIKEIDRDNIVNSEYGLIKEQAWYYEKLGTVIYGFFDGGRLVGLCCYWFGETYKQRNFWPLTEKEAKLVQILVLPDYRGKGIAGKLIKFSQFNMQKKGFDSLYARIWFTNSPSIRSFEKEGWKRIATVVEIMPIFFKKHIRYTIKYKGD